MAMAKWYTRGAFRIGSGATIWTADDIYAVLVRSGYTFSVAQNFWSELTDQVTGGGYAAQLLAGKTVTESDADEEIQYSATGPTFSNLTTTGIKGVVYLEWDGVSATSSPLLFYTEFPALLDRSSADLVVTVPPNGLAFLRLVSTAG